MKIGILGLGTIASCVAQDLARQGHEMRVTERSAARSAALTRAFANVEQAPPARVIEGRDVVFLGMTGAAAEAALTPLDFASGQHVVSFMGDIDTATLRRLIAPATLVAVMIPFPWMATSRAPALVLPQTDLLETLFAERHDLIALPDEAALRQFLTAQAVLSPALKLVATASDWLGTRTGAPRDAERFLRLLVGSALMAGKDAPDQGLADLLEALNTEGGYNRRLRRHLEEAGSFAALEDGLNRLGD